MLVSAAITKIRRLVNDTAEDVFTDTQIVGMFARAEQEFCRDTEILKDVVLLKAPPHYDYVCTYAWEEALVSGFVFRPFFSKSGYVSTQPWELEEEYTGDADGGYTSAGGVELELVEPQHEMPFPLPDRTYKVLGLFWDYRWATELSYDEIDKYAAEGWKRQSDIVDYFTHVRSLRKNALLCHGAPNTFTSSGTHEGSMMDTALVDDVFMVWVVEIPSRVTATGDTISVPDPFVKYIEMRVAEKLLRWDTDKYDEYKSDHFKARYQIGVRIVKLLAMKIFEEKMRRYKPYGGGRVGVGGRPPRPRLPAHYPSLEA